METENASGSFGSISFCLEKDLLRLLNNWYSVELLYTIGVYINRTLRQGVPFRGRTYHHFVVLKPKLCTFYTR